MFALLDPRIWLAALVLVGLAFAAGFWKGNTHGTHTTRLEWKAATAAANADARKLEQQRQRRVDDASRIDAQRQARNRAADARAGDGLEWLLHAAGDARRRAEGALDACRQHAATLEDVFGQCGRQLREVAATADAHASDSLKLQLSWPER